MKPINPGLDEAMTAGLDPRVNAVVLGTSKGEKRTSSGEPLFGMPEEKVDDAVYVGYVGAFLKEKSGDIYSQTRAVTDPEIGIGGKAVAIIAGDSRDDALRNNDNDPDQKRARGRNGLSQNSTNALLMEATLNGKKLAGVVTVEPHCADWNDQMAKLTGDPERVFSMTAAELYADLPSMQKVQAFVAPDESALLLNWICRNALQKKTGRKIPLYYVTKHRPEINQVALSDTLRQVEDDGSTHEEPMGVLKDQIVGEIDDCWDTVRTAAENVGKTLDSDIGAAEVHFAAALPILSGEGASNAAKLIEKHQGKLHFYTTDMLPGHEKITERLREQKVELAEEKYHVVSMAPALIGLVHHLAGAASPEDLKALERTMMPPKRPDKFTIRKNLAETGNIQFPSEEEFAETRRQQVARLGTVFERTQLDRPELVQAPLFFQAE